MGGVQDRGSRRVVLRIDSLRIINIYLTDGHYEWSSRYEIAVNG